MRRIVENLTIRSNIVDRDRRSVQDVAAHEIREAFRTRGSCLLGEDLHRLGTSISGVCLPCYRSFAMALSRGDFPCSNPAIAAALVCLSISMVLAGAM